MHCPGVVTEGLLCEAFGVAALEGALRPGFLDALAALGADAVHVFQPSGLLLNDVEDALAELSHQLLGVNGADALDHAAAQVFLDALLSRRRGTVEHVGAELEPELAVLPNRCPRCERRRALSGRKGSQGLVMAVRCATGAIVVAPCQAG